MLCNTVVQGTKQEIEAIIKLAEEELSGECYEVIEYKNLTVARLIFSDEPKEIIEEKFKSVKWMGFVEKISKWDGGVFLAISDKGNGIDNIEFLFKYDFHNDDRIASQYFPDESFSDEVFWWSASEYEPVDYNCPYYDWWMEDIETGICNLPIYQTPDKLLFIKYKSDLIRGFLQKYNYTTDSNINYLNEICFDEKILTDKNFTLDYYGISNPIEVCATLLSCLKAIGTFDDGLEKEYSHLASGLAKSFAQLECKEIFTDSDNRLGTTETILEKDGYHISCYCSSKED